MTDYSFYYFLSDNLRILMWAPIILSFKLVFKAQPDSSASWRVVRLVGAIGLLYFSANLILHLSYNFQWWGIDAYHAHFPQCEYKHCEGERKPRNFGANFAIYLILGWIPALIFVGFCELGWRYQHRHRIRVLKERDAGYFFSSALIILNFLFISLFYVFATLEGIERYGLFSLFTYIYGILYLLALALGMIALLIPFFL